MRVDFSNVLRDVITIADELGLPIKLVGTGEKPENLEEFDSAAFIEALLS